MIEELYSGMVRTCRELRDKNGVEPEESERVVVTVENNGFCVWHLGPGRKVEPSSWFNSCRKNEAIEYAVEMAQNLRGQ